MEKNNSTYIVSARKYRPQTFDTIVGQEHITNTLKNAILNNQIAQAYLFFGPRGVGKTTCARVFAKTINCLNLKENGEACNECASCKSFNSNTSFNIYELDAASNNSVEDIRQLIDQVRYPPQVGKYKVYIIDEVHMLSTAAFNAFLKTLEEPPSYAKFILATTEKNKVLPTILSRCQVFNFNRIKTEDIAKYLERIAAKENHQYEPEAIRIIAQKADGGLRDACSIYDQIAAFTQGNITKSAVIENLHVLDYDYYFQLTDAFLNNDYPKTLSLLDNILIKGFDPQNVLVGLIDHLRYLLLAKDPQTLYILDLSDSARTAIIEQSKKCNERFLLNALSILNKADINFRSSRHQRLHLEIHLLQICNLISTLNNEKKNLTDTNISSATGTPQSHHSIISEIKDTKIVKVSDKPVLKEVTVKTTASIKEISAFISHQNQNPPLTQKEITEYQSINPSVATSNEQSIKYNTDTSQDTASTAEQPTKDHAEKNAASPHSAPQTTIHPKNEPNNNIPISTNSSNQQPIDKNSSDNTNTQNKNTSSPQTFPSSTQKKYETLLAQNPLLEELKIKLNLQFK
ncbi:MAG: DNA polymerase III subunit gamma/tau [Bacteroidia bacterium]